MKNKLKEARKTAQLTQKEVAAMLNISYTTYNRYESGLIEPGLERLIKLAEIFKVTTDYLLMHGQSALDTSLDTKETKELVKKYQQLDERGKEAVYNTLLREYYFTQIEYFEQLKLKVGVKTKNC